jgi:uncharacterized protein
MLMKKLLATALAAFAPLLMLTFAQPSLAQGERPTHIRTIEVFGEGEIGVVPNEVLINLGIENTHKSLETAKAENDKRVRQVIQTLRDLGVEERHIQTAHVNIEPQYDYRQSGRVFLGYIVRRNINATIKDLMKLDRVTSAMVSAGITNIFNYEYRTSEETKYVHEARTKAIATAKAKAEGIAKDLGLNVVKAYSVIEENAGRPYYPINRRGMAVEQTMASNDGPTFSLGEIIVRSFVRVIFEVQ